MFDLSTFDAGTFDGSFAGETPVPPIATAKFGSAGRSAWTYKIDPNFFKGKKKLKRIVEEAEDLLSTYAASDRLFELVAPLDIQKLKNSLDAVEEASSKRALEHSAEIVRKLTAMIHQRMMDEEDDDDVLMLIL